MSRSCAGVLSRLRVEPPTLCRLRVEPPTLSRSGVEPPTGTIHPRASRGTANRKQESIKRFISGGCRSVFGIAGGYLAGMELSGRGFNPRPAQVGSVRPAAMGVEQREFFTHFHGVRGGGIQPRPPNPPVLSRSSPSQCTRLSHFDRKQDPCRAPTPAGPPPNCFQSSRR